MLKRLTGWVGLFLILAVCAIAQSTVAGAELQSLNYRLDETVVGVGDLNQSGSSSYKIVDATGDLAVGNTSGTSFQIETGSKTTSDPALAFSINGANVNFPTFNSTSASVTTANFSVLNYTSYGYVVQIMGNPPTNGSHIISPMTTTGLSQTGKEQFGINLVANTSPTSVGANLNNGQFGFGNVAPNYGTSNSYRYVNGEMIASAPKSSGLTTYTVTYLVNVASVTPGGIYTSNQTLVVTGTY